MLLVINGIWKEVPDLVNTLEDTMLKCVRGLLKIFYGKTILDLDGYNTNGSDTMWFVDCQGNTIKHVWQPNSTNTFTGCRTQNKYYYQVDEWGFVHKVESKLGVPLWKK